MDPVTIGDQEEPIEPVSVIEITVIRVPIILSTQAVLVINNKTKSKIDY
jgi:hypothetical protein